MKLSTGKIAFPIEFDNGDKDCIYFNPSDPNLSVRLKDFQGKVSERLKKFENIKIDNEGKPQTSELIEDFRNAQNIMCEELDIAFGSEISSIVFKHCSPFAIVNGSYFIIQFIEAIRPEIEKQIKKANADVEKKMAKHLDKYKK